MSEWKETELQEIGNVVSGGTPSTSNPKYWDGEILFVTPYDLSKTQFAYIDNTERKITTYGLENSSATLLPIDSVVISSRAPIGYVAIAKKELTTNQGCKSLIPNSGFDALFLYYSLGFHTDRLKKLGAGSTFAEISKGDLERVKLPHPKDKSEQRKIAEILSTCDAVIEQTEAAIEKYKAIKQGMLQDLFTRGIDIQTGKLRPRYEDAPELYKESKLGWIPKEWDEVTIEEFASDEKNAIVDGPFGSNLKTIHYRSAGVPVIQSGFVTSNKFQAKEYLYVDKEKYESEIRSKCVPGDIIMAKIGAQCGTCAILPKNHPVGILAGNCLKITVAKQNSNLFLEAYLHFLYQTGGMENITLTTAQPAISMSSLKVMLIKYPTPQEQSEVAKKIKSIDAQFEAEYAYLQKMQQIKRGLMEDLLTGKKEVKIAEEKIETTI